MEPPAPQQRDLFLHVLFLTDQQTTEVEPAQLIEQRGKLGTRLRLGSRIVTVLFNTDGPLGGRLTIVEGRKLLHHAELPQEIQENRSGSPQPPTPAERVPRPPHPGPHR